jgi:hypothetical protein
MQYQLWRLQTKLTALGYSLGCSVLGCSLGCSVLGCSLGCSVLGCSLGCSVLAYCDATSIGLYCPCAVYVVCQMNVNVGWVCHCGLALVSSGNSHNMALADIQSFKLTYSLKMSVWGIFHCVWWFSVTRISLIGGEHHWPSRNWLLPPPLPPPPLWAYNFTKCLQRLNSIPDPPLA